MSEELHKNPFIIDLEEMHSNYVDMWRRIVAMILDIMILLPFIMFNYYNSAFLKDVKLQFMSFTFMLIIKVFLELILKQTIGKKMLGIIIVRNDFTPATVKSILKRNIFTVLSLLFILLQSVLMWDSNIDSMAKFVEMNPETIFTTVIVMVHFCFGVSYLCGFITPKFQTIHDLFGETICIPKKKYAKLMKKAE